MIKIFWVGKKDHDHEDHHDHHSWHHHDSGSGHHDEHHHNFASEESALVWQVALDILENDIEMTIVAPIAWVDFENIDVSLEKNVLKISGRRELPEPYNEERVMIRNKECFWGDFSRSIVLPENLDFDSITAHMDNNLLMITIEKLRLKSSNIKINRLTD